jgi:hypothetical protein
MTAYEFPELTDEAAHYWLKMDTWKPYDAAWLLCGIDPHGMEQRYGAFATELCTQMCGDHPVGKAAFQVAELLKASSKAGSIAFPAAPGGVIAWARSKSLSLPSQFLDAGIDGTEQAAPVTGGAGGTSTDGAIVRIKRAALIAKYEREWPAIEDDLRHSNENGLQQAAKIPNEHGYWNEPAVVRWGSERGKLPVKQKPEAPKLDAMTKWALRQPS